MVGDTNRLYSGNNGELDENNEQEEPVGRSNSVVESQQSGGLEMMRNRLTVYVDDAVVNNDESVGQITEGIRMLWTNINTPDRTLAMSRNNGMYERIWRRNLRGTEEQMVTRARTAEDALGSRIRMMELWNNWRRRNNTQGEGIRQGGRISPLRFNTLRFVTGNQITGGQGETCARMRMAIHIQLEWSWILGNIPRVWEISTRSGQTWWRELNRLTRGRFIGWDTQAGRGHNLVGRELLNIRRGAGENGRRERRMQIQGILELVRRIGMRRRRKRGYVIMVNGVKIRFRIPPPPPPPPWPPPWSPPTNSQYQHKTTIRVKQNMGLINGRYRNLGAHAILKRNTTYLLLLLMVIGLVMGLVAAIHGGEHFLQSKQELHLKTANSQTYQAPTNPCRNGGHHREDPRQPSRRAYGTPTHPQRKIESSDVLGTSHRRMHPPSNHESLHTAVYDRCSATTGSASIIVERHYGVGHDGTVHNILESPGEDKKGYLSNRSCSHRWESIWLRDGQSSGGCCSTVLLGALHPQGQGSHTGYVVTLPYRSQRDFSIEYQNYRNTRLAPTDRSSGLSIRLLWYLPTLCQYQFVEANVVILKPNDIRSPHGYKEEVYLRTHRRFVRFPQRIGGRNHVHLRWRTPPTCRVLLGRRNDLNHRTPASISRVHSEEDKEERGWKEIRCFGGSRQIPVQGIRKRFSPGSQNSRHKEMTCGKRKQDHYIGIFIDTRLLHTSSSQVWLEKTSTNKTSTRLRVSPFNSLTRFKMPTSRHVRLAHHTPSQNTSHFFLPQQSMLQYKRFIQSPIIHRSIMQSNTSEMNDEQMKEASSLAGNKREAEAGGGEYEGEEEAAKAVSPDKSTRNGYDGMDVDAEGATEAAEGGSSPKRTNNGMQDIRDLFKGAKKTSATTGGAFDNVGNGGQKKKQQQQQFTVDKIGYRGMVHVELSVSNTSQVPKAVRDLLVQTYTKLHAESGKKLILLQVKKGGRPVKPISDPANFPHQWADIKKVALVYNNEADFKKPIKNKPMTFKAVMKLGSSVPIDEILADISLDLMNEGITVESKRHQAPISAKDMIIFMLPRHMNKEFVQETVQAGVNEGVEAYIKGNSQMTQLEKGLRMDEISKNGLLDVLVTMQYPPQYFHERGMKFRFNNQDKMAYVVEYDVEATELLREAARHIKSYLQYNIGRKAYIAFAPDESTAGLSSITFYRAKCDKNLVFQACTASTKLHGIDNMDGAMVIPLREDVEGKEVKITLRKLLQEYTLPGSDAPVVLAMGPAYGCTASWEVYFPQTAAYEDAMEKVMVHVASWAMYRLYYTYGCTSEGIQEYITANFSSMERRIAFLLSSYDVDNDVVTIDRSSLEVDEEEEEDNDDWMDMSILSPEGVSTLNKASMQAGILFDPDDQSSLGSLDTNAFETRKQGGAAATGNVVRGLRGFGNGATNAQTGSGDNGAQTTSGPSPDGEGQSTTASSGPGHCGGQHV